VKLRFGKFRGRELADVPMAYLAYLFEQADDIEDELRAAVRVELARRIEAPIAASRTSDHGSPAPELVGALIAAGFRRLAVKFHPDRGGDHRSMIAATRARDWLLQQVGAV
jgi:hypothetical protein